MSKEESIEKTLDLACGIIYNKVGCMGGNYCEVSTTGMSEELRQKKCGMCWKEYLMELVAERNSHEYK